MYICIDEEHAVGAEYDVRTDEEYIDFSMVFQIVWLQLFKKL